MRDFENMSEEQRERFRGKMRRHHRDGHIGTGVVLLLIGVGALLKSYVVDFPVWIFSWQMLLIVMGLFIGIRHRFHGAAWFVLLLVGGTFLVNDYFLDGDLRRHIWPVILIIVGAFFIFRSTQKPGRHWAEKKNAEINAENTFQKLHEEGYSKEDFIDTTSIFGGAKKNILSKDFRGGDVVNVFGGTELNLLQSDINGTAVLELTTIFGGTKLIVPSNWAVRSEVVTIFAGMEDKRQMPQVTGQPEKILLLKGTVIFGGIEIKSF